MESTEDYPHGTAFAVLAATALVFVLGAFLIVYAPRVAQLVFFVAFGLCLGMMDRARDRMLWAWAAMVFGSGLFLAVAIG